MTVKHGLCNIPEYNAWRSMLQRCRNSGHISYDNYGGRGISVCAHWQGDRGFQNFLVDMGRRPSNKHSIDRVNNDGNYEPENCKWATKSQQQFNQRPTKAIQNFTEEELKTEMFRRQPEYGMTGC